MRVNLRSSDGTGKGSLVVLAGQAQVNRVGLLVITPAVFAVRSTVANGCVDSRCITAPDTVTSKDGDGNEGAGEGDVEDDRKEGEEREPTHATGEDNGKDEVEAGCARHSFNGLLPSGDVDIAVSLNGQEIRVEPEDDGSSAEGQGVDGRLQQL